MAAGVPCTCMPCCRANAFDRKSLVAPQSSRTCAGRPLMTPCVSNARPTAGPRLLMGRHWVSGLEGSAGVKVCSLSPSLCSPEAAARLGLGAAAAGSPGRRGPGPRSGSSAPPRAARPLLCARLGAQCAEFRGLRQVRRSHIEALGRRHTVRLTPPAGGLFRG